jgi:uncharacterized membrane protein YhaH (DUF805 family)
MFSSPIGRGRYFVYSAALVVAEIIAVVLCVMATTGFKGLAESPPGPSRQGLALAVLIVSIILLVVRSNIAWRRSRDAEGSKWILGMYIVFSTFFAVLQSATLLVYKFDGDNSNVGLNILGLVLLGLWFRLLLAPSTGGPWDAAGFAASADAEVKARRATTSDRGAPAMPSQAPAVRSSAPVASPVASGRRSGGFGKRGLA